MDPCFSESDLKPNDSILTAIQSQLTANTNDKVVVQDGENLMKDECILCYQYGCLNNGTCANATEQIGYSCTVVFTSSTGEVVFNDLGEESGCVH